MKAKFLLALYVSLISIFSSHAQIDTSKKASRIILIPYQSMMYFSDDDPDLARYSKMDERSVRKEIHRNMDANLYHQLLANFDVISLTRATSLNGEEDLKHIYAATRYTVYSRLQKEDYQKEKGIIEKTGVKELIQKFSKKSKDQTFWLSDSSVMLAVIEDKEMFKRLAKKYDEQYVLFITQFEMNTDHKNSIEWLQQRYRREFIIHYNLAYKCRKSI